MSSYPKVEKAVSDVLKTAARHGETTRNSAVTLTWGKIEKLGGPSKFGIGTSAMIMGCKQIISAEVGRQFRSNLTEHEVEYILPTRVPRDLVAILGRVPHWIAIEEGSDALWMHWRKATADHWQANADLKRRKAEQTLNAARYSVEIADYLQAHGIRKLGDVFREK
jgi:hypothetical protein